MKLSMSNTYVIGDIHGGLRALKQALERAKITKEDRLIFLGDYVDGWNDSALLVDFLMTLKTEYDCIFMQGNHEEMVLKWLRYEEDNELWRFHGGQSTVNVYKMLSREDKDRHIEFFESLQHYFIDAQNRLFVHAGFTNPKGVEFEFFKPLFWWDRTLWETAMALDERISKEDHRYPLRFKLYDEIFIGHTPVTRFGLDTPMHCANVWNVDTGAAFNGKVTIMNVDTKEYWQSDTVQTLYPTEKGRN